MNRRRARRNGGRSLFSIAKNITLYGIPPILIGFFTYLFFFSRVFALDYIEVDVQGGIDASRVRSLLFQDMEKTRFQILSQKNIFAFDELRAESDIRDGFVVEQIKITKVLPNKLHVAISGKPFRALWYTGGVLYDVTTRGTIARTVEPSQVRYFPNSLRTKTGLRVSSSTPAIVTQSSSTASLNEKKPVPGPDQESSQVPIVVDEKNEPVQIDTTVLSPEQLTYILNLSKAVNDQGVHYDYFKTTRSGIDVRVVTNENWEILTANHEDPAQQMKAVSVLVREKIKGDRKKLKYIDVRFGNRVYYVYK